MSLKLDTKKILPILVILFGLPLVFLLSGNQNNSQSCGLTAESMASIKDDIEDLNIKLVSTENDMKLDIKKIDKDLLVLNHSESIEKIKMIKESLHQNMKNCSL